MDATSWKWRLAILGLGAILLGLRVVAPLAHGFTAREIAPFDPDELQHMHSAWCLTQGVVVYRDYFEHHTPLLYAQLAPILAWIQPERSYQAAHDAMLAGRTLAWWWIVCILVGTAAVGVLWRSGLRGLATGLVAASFLGSAPMFWDKVMEIRPAGPSVALLVGGVACFLAGTRVKDPSITVEPESDRIRTIGRSLACLLGGALVALALLHTQKILFVGPGLTVFWLWYCVDPRWGGTLRARLTRFAWTVLGFLLPMTVVLAWFYAQNALAEFVWFNLGFNAAWDTRFSPLPSLQRLFSQNYIDVQLGLLGIVARTATCWRSNRISSGDQLLSLVTLSGLAGLFMIQEPYYQYHQVFLPFVALFAADALVTIVLGGVLYLERYWRSERATTEEGASDFRLPASAAGVAATACIALLTYLATPLGPVYAEQTTAFTNEAQLANLRWVMENTTMEDTTFDGWPPYAAFRPHAWFYWSHQPQMVSLVPPNEKAEFIDGMTSGRIRPKIVAVGEFLVRFSPELTAYVEQNYTEAVGGYWIRRDGESLEH